MTPVLIVYDIDDTEGEEPLPEKWERFNKTDGSFNEKVLENTLKNCERDLLLVQRKELSQLYGGYATTRLRDHDYKMRIVVRGQLEPRSAYAVLCHELAHIYLGHLGSDKDNWWPFRVNLQRRTVEIEAEATSHIVCNRLGIMTHSREYLSSYIRNKDDLEQVSIDLICRVASHIEKMGKRILPPRKRKKKS